MNQANVQTQNGIPVKQPNKWLMLLALSLLPFMATVDGSATSIALPVMAQDMGVTTEAAQTVQIVYLTTVAITTLSMGRLGDIKGKGRVFLFGVAFFTVGTLLCAVSQSFALLIGARVIQALGVSAAMSVNQGIVIEAFPPAWRGRVLGIVGMAVGLGVVAGPLLGGYLVSAVGWHAIYLINLPIGITVLILGIFVVPRGTGQKQPLDVGGALLIAVPVFLFCFVLLGGQRTGYDAPYVPILLVAAAGLFALFLFVEKRAKAPLLDLRIFKNPLLAISLVCMAIQFFAVASSGVIQPYYMEDVLMLDAGKTGLVIAGMSIAMAAVSPLSGWISDRFGPRLITLIGTVMIATGLFLFATQEESTPVWSIVLFMALLGAGSGLFNSPNNSIIMSTATRENSGVTGSLSSFTRSFSNTTGSSVFTVVFYTFMSNSLGYKVTDFQPGQPQAFVSAMHNVYVLCGIIMLTTVALTAVRLIQSRANKKTTA